MKVVIIGCGLIGRKRARALTNEDHLVACCDTNKEVLQQFAIEFKCKAYLNYRKLLKETQCDVVIVSVVNKYAYPIINKIINLRKHILVEKPLGINFIEASKLVKNAKKKEVLIKTGFNHRFHPALWQAKDFIDQGKIGKLLIINARYGHGGRQGMETEWRASKVLCGGGELLDQGVHIIDLCHWFTGSFRSVFGKVATKFWNIEVEDNAFVHIESLNNVDIQFHVGWTIWKNTFFFELIGSEGYLKIEGLGGSYGSETLELGIRKKEGGIPDIKMFHYSEEDISWVKEWEEFKNTIKEQRQPLGNGYDGLYANMVIDAIYRSSAKGTKIYITTTDELI